MWKQHARGNWLLGVAMALITMSACVTWTEPEDVVCPPEGTELGYDNFAAGFFGEHCNRCHSALANDRHGAPLAYVFDTHDQIRVLSKRIFVRSAGDNASMPPGPDDPPQQARDNLAEWIACGMPE
ncbi:MAG TPA: hypothetical protein ENK23_08855 [Sorangium sp.]|nr:hypothetical protein [Sorangium sp.]